MASYFTLTKDTLGPAGTSVSIESGAAYATNQIVNLTIGTSDTPVTGYQMKIWGNVDVAYDANIQATEGASAWQTYATSKQIKLSATDGSKTIHCRIRDDVYNEGSDDTDSITLDTTVPVATITGPDVNKISKIATKDTSSFSFTCDAIFNEYKVKVVGSTGAAESTGTLIPTTAGSTNMSGNAGNYPASTPINCSIKGADLETASAADGDKIIKVFVKDASGLWSV